MDMPVSINAWGAAKGRLKWFVNNGEKPSWHSLPRDVQVLGGMSSMPERTKHSGLSWASTLGLGESGADRLPYVLWILQHMVSKPECDENPDADVAIPAKWRPYVSWAISVIMLDENACADGPDKNSAPADNGGSTDGHAKNGESDHSGDDSHDAKDVARTMNSVLRQLKGIKRVLARLVAKESATAAEAWELLEDDLAP